jgi:hypothetical protein
MIRRFATFAPVLALLLGCAEPAFGQVTYDASTGRYTVMVYDDEDRLVPMTFESPGRVRLRARGEVTTVEGGGFRYQWTVAVTSDSPDALGAISIPCPASSATSSFQFSTSRLPGRVLTGSRYEGTEIEFCRLRTRDSGGDSLTIQLISDFLPAFGELRAQGWVYGVSWPTSDPNASNDELVGIVDSLQGLDPSGVHVPVPTVVPTRAPDQVSRPTVALAQIQADLRLACDRGWVSPRGVCRSLEAKLTSVGRDLERNNLSTARTHLAAFRQELSNQERNHLTTEAASVLGIAAAVLASRLN